MPDLVPSSRFLLLPWYCRWITSAAVAALCLSVGCSSGTTGSVDGHITRSDGMPLVNARVTARAQETGIWVSDVTDDEGKFELRTNENSANVPAGDYQVSVVEDEGDWDHPTKPTIAAKYNTPTTSGIAFHLDAGEDKTLDLKVEPR